MDPPVQGLVRGLEAQQVAVDPRRPPRLEVGVRSFAEAERDREPRLRLDAADDVGDPVGVEAVVLARLQDDGPIAERPGLAHTVEHLARRDAIAPHGPVADADAAVGAAAHTVVGDLDQPAQVDRIADVAPPRLVGEAP